MASLLAARRQHLAATLVFMRTRNRASWRVGVGAVEMCALAKQSPLLPAIVLRDRSAVSITATAEQPTGFFSGWFRI